MSKGQEPYLSCWLLCLQHIYVAGARHLLNERMPPPHRNTGEVAQAANFSVRPPNTGPLGGGKAQKVGEPLHPACPRALVNVGNRWRRLAQVLPLPIISSPRSQRGFKSQTQNQATGNLEQTPTWTGVPRSWIANVET